ncbi:adenosylcobinamide-phosphate synthase CbiB [Rhodocyclus tenuis]|uniref:Cobalamin biosynthesis protein CobD n=1 Tax=Rhodocyclus tenuis TaxID=1066 RepID=A0A840GEH5_RHOTE|nr:adenosylcobinamide-phosphate synthase CbiB [Rhodocyclus tenuis]MBB4246619.1 adenosylcobinamide-phosphate synthase [Rhodocyclus tenuis]
MPLFALPDVLLLPLAGLAAVLLDRLFGEPPRFHPLVGFGKLADALAGALNRPRQNTQGGNAGGTITAQAGATPAAALAVAKAAPLAESYPPSTDVIRRGAGLLAWALAVLPWVALAAWLCAPARLGWIGDVLLLTLALGGRSLAEHAVQVGADLVAGDLAAARRHVSFLVSRNTAELDEEGVARACVESTLENGADAIFGALFWFALLGGPGAVLYRLANTLDAMWGYRTPRLAAFGWAAARLDDLLNYVPARLTAVAYALCGATRTAFACWRSQAPQWDSPNAGPVMAAGAGALGLSLGGAATYHGQIETRPTLGAGRAPRGADIASALRLVRRALALWLSLWFVLALAVAFVAGGPAVAPAAAAGSSSASLSASVSSVASESAPAASLSRTAFSVSAIGTANHNRGGEHA